LEVTEQEIKFDWGIIIFFSAMGLFMFIIFTLISFFMPGDFLTLLGVGIFWLFFWLFLASMLLLKIRKFIVVGTSGVYYRKGFFLWDEIGNIDVLTRTYRGLTSTFVTIYKSSGKKIRFSSRLYLLKEFPRPVERDIFPNLFKIYFELGRNPNL
jgi:hypothetical protein